jgi:hypothetical protein
MRNNENSLSTTESEKIEIKNTISLSILRNNSHILLYIVSLLDRFQTLKSQGGTINAKANIEELSNQQLKH